ncbi:MAG: hypothetical protein Q8K63_15100 [Acidimicrobiales bacterium]|nr:hypothetical protein [Acidimicrobiales bacterium]
MPTVPRPAAPRRSTGRPIVAALVVASLALVACGDDDEGSASTTDLAAFCAKAAETNQPGTLPTTELLAEYQALAPDEISDPVTVLVDAFAAAGDDPASAFSDPDVIAAIEQITEFESEQCALEPPQPGDADGPDAESTTPSSPIEDGSAVLSEEAFVAEANAICAAGNTEIEALAAETFGSGTPPTDEQLLDLLDQVLANVNAQIEAIDALTPPAELATTVDEWLSAGRSGLEAARAQGTAFFDPTGENPVSAEANRLATALGVTECA